MSEEQARPAGEPPSAAGPPGEPSEEELRAAYEAELSRLTSADLIAQAIVSLLNVGARRLGPVGGPAPGGEAQDAGTGGSGGDAGGQAAAGSAVAERDLEQVRDAIDAVRALLEVLERRVPEGLRPLRDALSQLQMAYAREVQAGAAGGPGGGSAPGEGPPAEEPGGEQGGGSGTGDASQPQEGPEEPGPAQRSGRLWVPGS